jgi:hypothetical protein
MGGESAPGSSPALESVRRTFPSIWKACLAASVAPRLSCATFLKTTKGFFTPEIVGVDLIGFSGPPIMCWTCVSMHKTVVFPLRFKAEKEVAMPPTTPILRNLDCNIVYCFNKLAVSSNVTAYSSGAQPTLTFYKTLVTASQCPPKTITSWASITTWYLPPPEEQCDRVTGLAGVVSQRHLRKDPARSQFMSSYLRVHQPCLHSGRSSRP